LRGNTITSQSWGRWGGGDYKEKDRRLKKKEQGGLDRANER